MRKGKRMTLQRSSHELDLLLGLHYRVTGPPYSCAVLAKPRESAFVVVEVAEHPTSTSRGNACVYLVAKKKLSTPEAAALLAKKLGGHAAPLGLKDTNATTLQLICVKPCTLQAPANMTLRRRQAWARLVARTTSCPSARALRGNRFIIQVEPDSCSLKELEERANQVLHSQLPAYYAYQRFGTTRPTTHYIGLTMLQQPHLALTREILNTPYPDESPAARRCRLHIWREDGCRIGRMYEPYLAQELPNASRIPRFLRSISSSALQAAIFNQYLSLRVETGQPLDRPLNGERRAENGAALAPVPPIGMKCRCRGEARRLLHEAAERLGTSLSELENPGPLLEARKGYWRPLYTTPLSPSIEKSRDEKRLILRFTMEKGMYATLVLRELIDPFKL